MEWELLEEMPTLEDLATKTGTARTRCSAKRKTAGDALRQPTHELRRKNLDGRQTPAAGKRAPLQSMAGTVTMVIGDFLQMTVPR